jgi:hypothetical protein
MMLDRIPARLGQSFVVTIESTSSPHLQGVGIGKRVAVFGETVERAVVWEYVSLPPELRNSARSELPFQFNVECRNKTGHLIFYNMASYKGRQEWWYGGAGMWAECIPGGKRYHCNDIERDEDFDDIIFTVTTAP